MHDRTHDAENQAFWDDWFARNPTVRRATGHPDRHGDPMIRFTPQAQDHYTVTVTTSNGLPFAGNRFHTRAAAETYAAPFLTSDRGYIVVGTCPSYDRVSLAERYG